MVERTCRVVRSMKLGRYDLNDVKNALNRIYIPRTLSYPGKIFDILIGLNILTAIYV